MEQSVLVQRVAHLSRESNPALAEHAKQRAESVQNRIADQITAFAGSMWFVYIHIVWFSCWIGFGVEKYPYGLLTMIVSLEAIFLSTFVMISQKTEPTPSVKSSPISNGRPSRKRTSRTKSCSTSPTRSSN